MNSIVRNYITAVFLLVGQNALAQGGAAPSRTIYKCDTDGITLYSSEPCRGAKKIIVELPRELNPSVGRPPAGAEVNRERYREEVPGALQSPRGMTPQQIDIASWRSQLRPSEKVECAALDKEMAMLEREERASQGEYKTKVQQRLVEYGKRHRDIRC